MIALGLDSSTALGRALAERGVEEGELTAGRPVVVCAGATSPVEAVDAALEAGSSVLVEMPTHLPAEHIRRFAGDSRVRSGLDFRYDPSLQRATAAIRSGSIGLAWAANAEIVWPASEANAAAANVLDALRVLVAVRPLAATRLAGDVALLALTFEHGVVGTVVAVPRPAEGDPAAARARVRVYASHGIVEVELDGPRLVRSGSLQGAVQGERSGAARLLDAFALGTAPPLADVADTLACVSIEEEAIA